MDVGLFGIQSKDQDFITYIIVVPVPIWPITKRHDFPEKDTITPHITGRAELPVL